MESYRHPVLGAELTLAEIVEGVKRLEQELHTGSGKGGEKKAKAEGK